MEEKTLDYYLSLPYTVKARFSGDRCTAWIEELPCRASVGKDESVETLFGKLEKSKRRYIENALSEGQEIPEPPKKEMDPFWEEFDPEGVLEGPEIEEMIHYKGASDFPLRVLEKYWLAELMKVGLFREEATSEAPHKGWWSHHFETSRGEGEVYPVRLGKSGRRIWLKVDGRRTERGYREIVVLDQPLKTETAIIAALTILAGRYSSAEDLEPLCEAISRYVADHPQESEGRSLNEIYNTIVKRARYDGDEELQGVLLGSQNAFAYSLALLRCRRPGFDNLPFREQLSLTRKHHDYIDKFLNAAKDHGAFLEYGTPDGIPTRTVRLTRTQVQAAVLADVCGMNHKQIADEMQVSLTERDEDNFYIRNEIPKIKAWIRDGRKILDRLPAGGWKEGQAKAMRAEAERWRNLSAEEKRVERLAEMWGSPLEFARDLPKDWKAW